MAVPNSSIFHNWTGMTDLFSVPNQATDGMFGLGLWFCIWFIFFIVMVLSTRYRENSDLEAAVASSLIMIPISVEMGILNIVSNGLVIFPIAISVISMLALMRRN